MNHLLRLRTLWGACVADARASRDRDGFKPINARLDKSEGKFWRNAFEKRRAVIPAEHWYEWRKEEGGKQPYAIRPAGNAEAFFFACVWSVPKELPDDDPWHD